jgi:hypothetical protein
MFWYWTKYLPMKTFKFYPRFCMHFSQHWSFFIWLKQVFKIRPIPMFNLKEMQSKKGNLYQNLHHRIPFWKEDFSFFCSICNTHVGERSKHCGECNRCVSDFDHHCKWLNNCIGRKNYFTFVKLISSVLLLAVFFIIISSIGLSKT